jgi:hypothetical protein
VDGPAHARGRGGAPLPKFYWGAVRFYEPQTYEGLVEAARRVGQQPRLDLVGVTARALFAPVSVHLAKDGCSAPYAAALESLHGSRCASLTYGRCGIGDGGAQPAFRNLQLAKTAANSKTVTHQDEP